jgi:hypothetical protein
MQCVEKIGSLRLHGRSRNRLLSINFAFAPWPSRRPTEAYGMSLYPDEPTVSA